MTSARRLLQHFQVAHEIDEKNKAFLEDSISPELEKFKRTGWVQSAGSAINPPISIGELQDFVQHVS